MLMENIFLYILGLCIGIPIIIKSGDYAVEAGKSYSKITGISTTAIGAIIIATLTSLPELFVSLSSITVSAYGILFGNIIGSNIADILLLCGITGAIFGVKIKNNKKYLEIIVFSTIPIIYGSIFGFDSTLGWLSLILFFFLSRDLLVDESRERMRNRKIKEKYAIHELGKLLVSIIILLISSEIVVISLQKISDIFGLSDMILSSLLLAVSTSLPELSISYSAGKKREYDILLGNLVGSCFVNTNLILGMGLIASRLILNFPAVFLLLTNLFSYLVLILALADNRIERFEGIIFLFFYAFYFLISITML